ncbi:MAG: pyridoxamine 5'-phosphate oxidase family protein [Dehalococcoidia bacterium]
MPGYGILDAQSGQGLLPWSWAEERLERARNYFVATVRPDGAPHAMPVWGVWLDGAFSFSTGGRSRKARNLAANARCVVSPEHAEESIVLEGVAERVVDAEAIAQRMATYRRKYGTGFPVPEENPVFAVRPRVVFGIIEHNPEFSGSATRWRFDDA